MQVAHLGGGHVKPVDAILMQRAIEPVRFAEQAMVGRKKFMRFPS